MLTEERYSRILEELNTNNTVQVSDLVEIIGASESTVRRDLLALEELGKLKKVHGGAVAVESPVLFREPDVEEKMKLNEKEKDAVAKYAASTINKNDFVFIDAGTTTERMIDYITEYDATFVTNAFIHANLLARRGFKVILTGGEVKASTQALVGTACIESIKNYNFTKCFLGTNGITKEAGFSTPDVDEASVKRTVCEHSYVSFILADSSKFDITSAVTFCSLDRACIITDKLKDDKYKGKTVIKEVIR